MSRPQIQEEAVTMLANELQERVRPDGLAIVMEADHFCMHWRGVKDTDSAMVNSVMRGAFLKDANLRREFLSLLPPNRKPERVTAMLVRLMYASRAVPAVDQERLLAILRKSKANNPAVGVTGVLCFRRRHLPAGAGGRAQRVNQLYNRIAADPCHTDVELLVYEEIGERRFAGWSMGQVNMARLNPALLLKYSATADAGPVRRVGRRCRWRCSRNWWPRHRSSASPSSASAR